MRCLCIKHTFEFSFHPISSYSPWRRYWMFYSINWSFLWTAWTPEHDNISIRIRCFHCWVLRSWYFKLFCFNYQRIWIYIWNRQRLDYPAISLQTHLVQSLNILFFGLMIHYHIWTILSINTIYKVPVKIHYVIKFPEFRIIEQ